MNWKTSLTDAALIDRVVDRALSIAKRHGMPLSRTVLEMDVTACHCNGCPLDLEALAAADDFNFAHDIFGIRRHIDRETGKLADCFFPRFSARNTLAA